MVRGITESVREGGGVDVLPGSVHQGQAFVRLACSFATPAFVDRPDLGAVAATIVVEPSAAADKEQRAGTAKRTGKLIGLPLDVHGIE